MRQMISNICNTLGIPSDTIMGSTAGKGTLSAISMSQEMLRATVISWRNILTRFMNKMYDRIYGDYHFRNLAEAAAAEGIELTIEDALETLGSFSVMFNFSSDKLSYEKARNMYEAGDINASTVMKIIMEQYGIGKEDMGLSLIFEMMRDKQLLATPITSTDIKAGTTADDTTTSSSYESTENDGMTDESINNSVEPDTESNPGVEDSTDTTTQQTTPATKVPKKRNNKTSTTDTTSTSQTKPVVKQQQKKRQPQQVKKKITKGDIINSMIESRKTKVYSEKQKKSKGGGGIVRKKSYAGDIDLNDMGSIGGTQHVRLPSIANSASVSM
jgi:hypothetical protein